MMRRDFQLLTATRLREAKILASAHLYDGAYYFGGLAVECALKSAIARMTPRYEFPDLDHARRVYTHSLETLLKSARLYTTLGAAEADVREAWSKIKSWNIEARYQSGREASEVISFLDAVAGRRGVLRWLKQYW